MSLKYLLTELIWSRGYLSFEEMEEYCRSHGYRSSNGARRLRESESPTIKAVFKGKAIIGYEPRREKSPLADNVMERINNLPPAFEKKKQETLL